VKKTWCAVISILLVTLFTWSPVSAKTELTYISPLGGPRRATFQELLNRFEVENPDYTVNWIVPGRGLIGTIELSLSMIAAGTPPDVVRFQEPWAISSFAAQGLLEDLGPYVGAENYDLEDFIPSVLEMARFQGMLYGIPQSSVTQIMLYNKNHLDSAGITEPAVTQEDLLVLARRLSSVSEIPVSVENPWDMRRFGMFAFPNGASFFSDEALTQPAFNSEPMLASLNFLMDGRSRELFTHEGTFTDGNVGAITAHPIIINQLEAAGSPFEVVPSLTPAGSAGHANPSNGHYLSMTKATAHKEGAWKLIKFLASPEVSDVWHRELNFMPQRISILRERDYYRLHPVWSTFFEQLLHNRPMPILPEWGEMEGVFAKYVRPAWNGEISPEEALNQVQEQVSALINSRE